MAGSSSHRISAEAEAVGQAVPKEHRIEVLGYRRLSEGYPWMAFAQSTWTKRDVPKEHRVFHNNFR
ncbi:MULTISPECIES: hypothetical protein [unclassified Moorena]|uniref:hypothetical protein n=1 Tax=unclassified Moorena TaxID=2683338 RepID=UPI0013B85C6F|nr:MULTISPECIES: hypothetical protein [unclassified Moorena]NEP32622.1 hypothetical protein [Moorena sp. SIO3B2]NER86384.1 hypothetical protein [Moorena sp. SIO3A2]